MGRGTATRAGFAVAALGSVVACLFLLNSKTTEPPSPALADEIDRVLVRDPCIGSIEDWTSREYSWGRNSLSDPRFFGSRWLGSDTSIVHVSFYRGDGSENYPPGRQLLRADQVRLSFDSSPELFLAYAEYDVEARRLTDFECGPNYPSEVSETNAPL